MTAGPGDEGPVDPADVGQVTAVLSAALGAAGVEAVADLAARMPGARVLPGSAAGFLRPATPATLWVGPEHAFTLTDSVEHRHVVGGVVLSRDPVPPARVAALIAPLLVRLVTDQGAQAEAALVLTAAREVYAAME